MNNFIKQSLEKFREKFVINVFGYPKAEEIEAFLKQELEACMESAYKEGYSKGAVKYFKEGIDAKDLEKVKESARKEAVEEFAEVVKMRGKDFAYYCEDSECCYAVVASEIEDAVDNYLDALSQPKEKICKCECHVLGENYPCNNPNCKPKGEDK